MFLKFIIEWGFYEMDSQFECQKLWYKGVHV